MERQEKKQTRAGVTATTKTINRAESLNQTSVAEETRSPDNQEVVHQSNQNHIKLLRNHVNIK